MQNPQTSYQADITITDCGTFAILIGETLAGLGWLKQNLIADPHQWLGHCIIVDSRITGNLLDEALDADLEVAA